MRKTDRVADPAEPLNGIRTLPKHFSGLVTDSVHDEMRMDMRRINMRGDQHLALRPCLRGKFFCDGVRLRAGYVFIWSERLRVVIEPNRTLFSKCLPCRKKLLQCKRRRAVLTADELVLFGNGFVLALDVLRHGRKRAGTLPGIRNEIDSCHYCCSICRSSPICP